MRGITARKQRGPSTVADVLAMPEAERRHEVIDGEIVQKEAATGEHGAAQINIATSLNGPFGRRPPGGPPDRPGGWWFATEVEIRFGEHLLRPDVAGWRRERVAERPRGCPVEALPDWTCEILSTNRVNDLVRKKRIYHEHRVPHYWIADPAEGTLAVQRWSADGYVEVVSAVRGERVRAEPFDALELPVGVFFGDDDGG